MEPPIPMPTTVLDKTRAMKLGENALSTAPALILNAPTVAQYL